jgi:hypothetical protein
LLNAPVISFPDGPRAPFHAPEAVQLVTLVELHVSCELPFGLTVSGFAVSVSVGAPGAADTFTVTERLVLPPPPVHRSVKLVVLIRPLIV